MASGRPDRGLALAPPETARLADYVLPAVTQFEKYEATFFNFEFPKNAFHLRHPLLAPPDGPLSEPEIHARLVEAAGVFSDQELEPLRDAARRGRREFAAAFAEAAKTNPRLGAVTPVVLYRTLGPTLQKSIAIAFVDSNLAAPGKELAVDLRGTLCPARIVPLPFYKRNPT